MRRWKSAFASVAALALAAGSAAADEAQQLGPFRVGMTIDEARAATQGASWEDVTDDHGRVVGAKASKVWTFEGAEFDAEMRHASRSSWSLTLTSSPTADAQKPCRNRLKSLIKFMEPAFGVLEVPMELRTQFTGGGGVTVQRINGYPVVTGVPGTATNVHETYSAGEDSQFAAEYEEDDGASWTARTPLGKWQKPMAKVVANWGLTETKTPTCIMEVAISQLLAPPESAPIAETLAHAFEPAFVAEFPAGEAEAAREAWKKRGVQILKAVERDLFPVPDAAEFTANALAALRAKRAAEPAATPNALIEAAFAGSRLPKGAGIDIHKYDRPKPAAVSPQGEPEKTAETKEPPPSVSVRTVGSTAVIKVASFTSRTSDGVVDALANVKGDVIVDIRGNQGGLFDEIIRSVALFVGPGKLVAKVETRSGMESYRSPTREEPRSDLNLVVLVDQDTNSGAMMFAAALADHSRARIAGAAVAQLNGLTYAVRVLDLSFKDPDSATAVRFPTGVIYRVNGAKLSDGVKLDRSFRAKGDAAITEAAKLFAKPKTPETKTPAGVKE